jgi:tellurite resistance-related uncharacterized protein
MQSTLPDDLTAYKRTPVFDQDSLPAGLRREHRTKEGVWALIRVLEGRLLYRILTPFQERVLTPEISGVVEPQQAHEVQPLGPVRFFVEFYAARAASDDPHQPARNSPPAKPELPRT